jgi:hypothetical protein
MLAEEAPARGAARDLVNPHPLAAHLPGIYQEDDGLALAMAAGLDEVLAPIFAVLDSLDAYFDPRLAPEDFLGWVAGWLAIRLDAVSGARVFIRESGGTASSTRPGAPLPGSPAQEMVVRFETADATSETVRRLDALVTSAKPAHVNHRVEVVQSALSSP